MLKNDMSSLLMLSNSEYLVSLRRLRFFWFLYFKDVSDLRSLQIKGKMPVEEGDIKDVDKKSEG